MAQGGYYDGNIHDLVTCPYNKAHKVGVSKFPNHVVKCRKQYPELAKEILICNFNQSHHIPMKDMGSHLITCEEYKAHLLHSVNSCRTAFLPKDLHKPLADSVNPDLEASRRSRTDEVKFPMSVTQEELEEWI